MQRLYAVQTRHVRNGFPSLKVVKEVDNALGRPNSSAISRCAVTSESSPARLTPPTHMSYREGKIRLSAVRRCTYRSGNVVDDKDGIDEKSMGRSLVTNAPIPRWSILNL
mmetsp:Transcript_1043/g.2421  ORF Transcript_1043/g.2421 Transcript_1043/m.2421 type:complete len:110 (+) Transcript_1043:1529-1858(+)